MTMNLREQFRIETGKSAYKPRLRTDSRLTPEYAQWLEERLKEQEFVLKAIEDNAWDIRCENRSLADTGDVDIQWVVYEHHMGKDSVAIGYGNTPIKAVIDAEVMVHGSTEIG